MYLIVLCTDFWNQMKFLENQLGIRSLMIKITLATKQIFE